MTLLCNELILHWIQLLILAVCQLTHIVFLDMHACNQHIVHTNLIFFIYLFHMTGFYKCWPISIIFGTQYTELVCNIFAIYLPTSPTVPWEISQVHNHTCKLKTLGILLYFNTASLTAQPSEFKVSYCSKCSKCPSFSFTQASSLFRHSSSASSAILCDSPFHVSVKPLLQIGHVSKWHLINTILHNLLLF